MRTEKYLPIGSVVLLKDASKKVMIIGYNPCEDDGTTYDYVGCLYPEGVSKDYESLAFMHYQIQKLFHFGMSDEEEKAYHEKIS